LNKITLLLLTLFSFFVANYSVADYSKHPEVGPFIDRMVSEHGFERQQVQNWLSQARYQKSIVDAMSRPAEKVKTWYDYRKIFITDLRIERGVEFWQANRQTLQDVSEEYGVDPAIIVSIIGVETNYGRNTGRHRVIDALSTLAFDFYTYNVKRESRKKFFTTQLEHLFLLAREQNQDPMTLKGSYAGAMGWGQFMPNSYRNYAVDYDGDGLADIWNNPDDVIASVANYFVEHGWKRGQPVATRTLVTGKPDSGEINKLKRPKLSISELEAMGYKPITTYDQDYKAFPMLLAGKYGEEYWLGLHNFYVIGRYNPRIKYAMAVYQLSTSIRGRYCDTTANC
jgi:membrane-bound lytic murein transglycosylase B